MPIPIPINSSPQLISRSVANPYLILNTGTEVVYLGQDSSVSPMNYAWPLAPNSALQWTEITSDVYGVTASGHVSQIVVAPNASALAIGSVALAAGSSVGINGTVPVNGNVGVSGNVGSYSAANPQLLAQASISWNPALQNYYPSPADIAALSGIDVSAYSSVILVLNVPGAGAAANVPNYITATITEHEAPTQGGSIAIQSYNPQWLINSGVQSVQVPVAREFMTISLAAIIGLAAGNGTIKFSVFGSHEVISAPKYVSSGSYFEGSIPIGGFWELAQSNNVATNHLVATKNGPATTAVLNQGSTGGQIDIYACQSGVKTLLYQNTTPSAPGGTQILSVLLPMLPIECDLYSSAGTSVQTTLIQ